MNRTLKAIIVAVALIFVGAVLAGCGLFGMNGAWDMLTGNGKLVTTQETITGDFTNIHIDVVQVDVELRPSPDGTCYYIAETYDNMFCTAEVENSTLKIGQDDNRKWYQHIGIYWDETSLVLYLPKDAYDQLTISGNTSDVVIPNHFTFENASITTSTGDIDCHAQVTGQLKLACSTGDIGVRGTYSEQDIVAPKVLTVATSTGDVGIFGVCAETASVTTSTGQCWFDDSHVQQTLFLSSSTGNQYPTNVTCGSLSLKTSTGDVYLTNVVASGDATLRSSTGDWELEGFDAANITITTDTGDVDGTLLSEKIFFVDTDTGDVDVPRTTSGGTCQITTDTGDIEIGIAP